MLQDSNLNKFAEKGSLSPDLGDATKDVNYLHTYDMDLEAVSFNSFDDENSLTKSLGTDPIPTDDPKNILAMTSISEESGSKQKSPLRNIEMSDISSETDEELYANDGIGKTPELKAKEVQPQSSISLDTTGLESTIPDVTDLTSTLDDKLISCSSSISSTEKSGFGSTDIIGACPENILESPEVNTERESWPPKSNTHHQSYASGGCLGEVLRQSTETASSDVGNVDLLNEIEAVYKDSSKNLEAENNPKDTTPFKDVGQVSLIKTYDCIDETTLTNISEVSESTTDVLNLNTEKLEEGISEKLSVDTRQSTSSNESIGHLELTNTDEDTILESPSKSASKEGASENDSIEDELKEVNDPLKINENTIDTVNKETSDACKDVGITDETDSENLTKSINIPVAQIDVPTFQESNEEKSNDADKLSNETKALGEAVNEDAYVLVVNDKEVIKPLEKSNETLRIMEDNLDDTYVLFVNDNEIPRPVQVKQESNSKKTQSVNSKTPEHNEQAGNVSVFLTKWNITNF